MSMNARPPWDEILSDGCTVPRSVFAFFRDVEPFYEAIKDEACLPHDRRYYEGGGDFDRLIADVTLYRDALVAAKKNLPTWSDAEIALTALRTYQAVRLGGGDPTHWYYPPDYTPTLSDVPDVEPTKEQAP